MKEKARSKPFLYSDFFIQPFQTVAPDGTHRLNFYPHMTYTWKKILENREKSSITKEEIV